MCSSCSVAEVCLVVVDRVWGRLGNRPPNASSNNTAHLGYATRCPQHGHIDAGYVGHDYSKRCWGLCPYLRCRYFVGAMGRGATREEGGRLAMSIAKVRLGGGAASVGEGLVVVGGGGAHKSPHHHHTEHVRPWLLSCPASSIRLTRAGGCAELRARRALTSQVDLPPRSCHLVAKVHHTIHRHHLPAQPTPHPPSALGPQLS